MAKRSGGFELLSLAAICALAAGCAHRAADQPRSWGGGAEDPKLSALEAELEDGEQRLNLALGAPPSTQPRPAGETPGAPPAAPPPATTPAPPAPGGAPAAAEADLDGESPQFDDRSYAEQPASAPPAEKGTRPRSACEEGCDAFESMERAAQRICRLTGEGTPRCARARDRIATARDQLAAAGCGCGAK